MSEVIKEYAGTVIAAIGVITAFKLVVFAASYFQEVADAVINSILYH